MSTLRHQASLDHEPGSVDVQRVPVPSVGYGGHDIRAIAFAADHLVSGDLVGEQPEERRECSGTATRAGLGELQDGMGHAAQVASGDGAARAGSAGRGGGSR